MMRLTTILAGLVLALAMQTNARADSDWSGFYFGAQAGAAFSSGSAGWFPPPGTMTGTNFVGGAFAGYNFVRGNIVFGPEIGVFAGSNRVTGSAQSSLGPLVYNSNYEIGTDAIFYANARVGMAHNGWLGYVTGGVALASIVANKATFDTPSANLVPAFSGTTTQSRAGINIGVGVERMVTQRVAVGLDWRYVNFGSQNHNFGTSQVFTNVMFSSHIVSARLILNLN